MSVGQEASGAWMGTCVWAYKLFRVLSEPEGPSYLSATGGNVCSSATSEREEGH